ncbi:MAG: aldehyde dehydrogenase family protein [Pseudorhodoplanes sp.]|nr:aldehyde dehydrogenase family protein [Pseudorhodoplanes sp.]
MRRRPGTHSQRQLPLSSKARHIAHVKWKSPSGRNPARHRNCRSCRRPVTTQQQRQRMLNYIDIARDEGANVLLGRSVAADPALRDGSLVQPAIFGEVNNRMRIAQEAC